MSDWWSSLILSLRIAGTATLAVTLIGVPLAYLLARRRVPFKGVIEAGLLLPLVLPPTVVGYVLIVVLGKFGLLGHFLGGYSILFRFEGAVLAAAVVAFPMAYLPAKAAFAGVDRDLEDAARVAGASGLQLFAYVSLPLAGRGVAAGLVLAFARALGEFGATMMVYAWQEDRITLPVALYEAYLHESMAAAAPAAVTLGVISLALVVAFNLFTRRP